MKVYEKVRIYIEKQGLKQVTVAQRAGMSNVTFNAILNGKRTLYADDLRAICLALNVSPELFIEFPGGHSEADGQAGKGDEKMSAESAAKVVALMGAYLEKQLASEPKKLWENTFICHQLDKRTGGGTFTVADHLRGMVYSMLSAGILWERVKDHIDEATGQMTKVDEAFHDFDLDALLQDDPERLRDEVKRLGCASQYTMKQMTALVKVNIPKLLSWQKQYGSIDGFYREADTLTALVKRLSDPSSPQKLSQMGEALTAEYLKNVGYDLAKPDRHLRRILGSEILGCSQSKVVPIYETFDIVASIADKLHWPAAKVDYILWSYCATGYGEICTADKPKCEICAVKDACIHHLKGEKI